MDTAVARYATSPDGARIAYDVGGSGAPLLLLPGHSGDRRSWHSSGYAAPLWGRFTVICMDPRGQGESDLPHDPAAYAVDRLVADVCAVADACGRERFAVWGYSFGGTLALQLAARCPRVTRAVVVGSHFGRAFSDELASRSAAQARTVAKAKDAGQLHTLPLTPEQRAVAERIDIPAHIACIQALPTWPAVEPAELRCPTLVCSGAEDRMVTPELEPRRAEIEAAGILLRILPNLDHTAAFTAAEMVLPVVEPFLLATAW